jgi:hypothetical protein
MDKFIILTLVGKVGHVQLLSVSLTDAHTPRRRPSQCNFCRSTIFALVKLVMEHACKDAGVSSAPLGPVSRMRASRAWP